MFYFCYQSADKLSVVGWSHLSLFAQTYHIYPKNLDRQAWANSVDPNQTAPKEQFDQGPHCLQLHHNILDTSKFKF